MSSSNFFMKPPVLMAAVVLIALIALSTNLKQKAEAPDRADGTEQTEIDRLNTGGARISKISAPSVSSHKESAGSPKAVAQKQAPRAPIVENFDAAMKRAEGEAVISGTVYGQAPEAADERDRMRSRGNDSGSSSSRESRMNWWRDRMSRNKPLEAAEVLLYEDDPNTTHPPLRTAVTNKEGSFTLTALNDSNQRYILVVKADKYAPEATFVSLNLQPREVDVVLEEGVPLRGKVLDSETSEPVSGAVVYYPNPNWGTFAPLGVTTTTISGEYYFPNVNPGRLLSQASAQGYATSRVRLRAPDESSTIELQPGGASISGVTIDRLTGKPQGGARVWATSGYRVSESVISREDGTFEVANLPEGDYEVYAVRGMKSPVQTVSVERKEQVKDIKIIMPAMLLVSGQVVHATERKPLEGIKVWYQSSKGSQYKRTNVDGRFSFETMAIDEYSIMIHEKGFLPVGDTNSSGSNEIISRKVASNQSSDELTIRLKPVRTFEGKVVRDRPRRGGSFGGFGDWFGGGGGTSGGAAEGENANKVPAVDADVTLYVVEGKSFSQKKTKTDAIGNFFFNIPEVRRAEGFVVASQSFMMDGKDVRVPRNKPVELSLGRNIAMGQLLLSDESSLDGVGVSASILIPRKRADSSTAHRIKISDANTMRGGRLFMGLPPNQDVELAFSLPDGNVVRKEFKTNQLLRGSSIFVYDPVSQDIVADTRAASNGGGPGGGRNRGTGGQGNQNGGRRNNNGGQNNGTGAPGANPESAGGATNLTGAPASAAQ